MAALPGAGAVLPWLCSSRLRGVVEGGARLLGRVGLRAGTDMREVWRGFGTLADADTRRAFLDTMRTVVDAGGQRASALDRLYLAAQMPTLIVWGEDDKIIPVAHARAAHAGIEGSRLDVFPGAGHFPHLDAPARFVSILMDFVRTTRPARTDAVKAAEVVRRRANAEAAAVKLRAA
jgi:pimeloyl-ACP methyl ester carboxylesterase